MSKVLEALYASAPSGDYAIYTLDLIHSSFEGGVIRLCQGFDDITATLETGETVTFLASGFGLSLARRAMRGNQGIQFQLDNVTGEAINAVDAANEVGGTIGVAARIFVASDLSAPSEPPAIMTATAVKTNVRSVMVVAGFHDLTNKAWPARRYTPEFAPGLKYFS